MFYNGIDDPYLLIASAILKQAADDYIEALEKGSKRRCQNLERFFLSDYGQTLSKNLGEAIIRNCKRIAAENKRDDMKQNE